ncbi:hypothetical protein E1A91_D13G272300v1 [Gossypium mustelinum]|uniref:Homeobox domain-containing protein n=1 Tax=Gossypium mustelinum TaxID=34275 RepID=A0A5D2S9A5_GOSMU|nr:hypothetical protein E1A91_D13G272300v1 [Gossypium mustelinum]
MEGGGGGGGGGGGNSRWNPTKEQISMLESLYKQGIRTPSADQIQQITSRLKAYGTIEGKNVFYWFQNHKARQRQKQKQENLAYINRYIHHHHRAQPVFHPPPCTNVVCAGPYFVPQADHHHLLGFYPQCPKVLLPSGSIKRRGRPIGKTGKALFYNGNAYDHTMVPSPDTENLNNGAFNNGGGATNHHETLPLFPLHPTGVSEETLMASSSPTGSTSCETTISAGGVDNHESNNEGSGEHRFIDFF